MAPKLLAACLLVLALPVGAPAQTAALAWEYDTAYVPPVVGFLLTVVEARGASQQFQVALSLPGACDGFSDATDQTFCTKVPCPAPGSTVVYRVQATVSETVYSQPSESFSCFFPPGGSACTCAPATSAAAVELPPVTTPPPPLPQKSAEGLNLQPIGPLPPIPTLPSIPASGGT